MKRLLFVIFAFIGVFASCLPLIEPATMSDQFGTLDISKTITLAGDIVMVPGATVDGVDISTIGGASHAQGTDTTLGVQTADANWGGFDITNVGLVDGVDISASVHAQNTDWTLLNATGGVNLIHNGYIASDLRTDRWSLNDDNTFFGVDVAGGLGGLTGDMNTAYGTQSMYNITSGDANTAVGWRSQRGLTDGDFNTAIGEQSLTALTTGHGNTAVGVSTLASVTTTGYNTGVGADVLWNATSAYNTAMGAFAGAAVVDGGYNTYMGYDAGNDNVSGDNNVAVGAQAGHTNTGSGNVFLGYKAGEDSAAVSNTLYIDNSDDATPLIYGDFSTDKVTINEDLDVADDLTVTGTINTPGDAIIKTDGTSARDLTITTGAQKTILLSTPVYDDMQISMANVKTPASSAPTWTPYKGSEVPAFSKTATNVLYFSAQMPHSYDEGTNIEFHIHVAYPDNGAGNSVWYMTYSWANIDGAFPAASNSGNVIVASPATADYHDDPSIVASINGAGKTISSVLLCSISRLGGDGSDDYDNVIYLVSGDFHYQKDTIGSRQQLIK